jgi:DNA polymerase-3 subunit beta
LEQRYDRENTGGKVRFSVNKTMFNAAIATVSVASEASSLSDILGAIQLTAKDGHLNIRAVGGQIAMDTHITADVSDEGTVMVPSAVLGSVARAAQGADIEVELRGSELTFLGSRGESGCRVLADSGYPYPALDAPTEIGEVDGSTLADAVHKASACAVKGVHIVYAGLRLRARAGVTSVVGCDGNRAVRTEIGMARCDIFEGIIPAKAAAIVGRLASGRDSASLSGDKNRIGVTVGGYHMRAVQMEGAYPEIEKLFPKTLSTTVKVDAIEFLGAMDRAKSVAKLSLKDFQPNVSLLVGESTVSISCRSEVGSMDERLAAEVEGDLIPRAVFKWNFLADVATWSEGDIITLGFVGEKNNALFVENDNWKYMAMGIKGG